MTENSNGRVALVHAIAEIDKVYTGCTALASKPAPIPDMSQCPNHVNSGPWYSWATSVNTTILFGMAQLALWRKDDLEKALASYDREKESQRTKGGAIVEIPVPFAKSTIKAPSWIFALIVVGYVGLMALGIDPLASWRREKLAKQVVLMEGVRTNLVEVRR